MNNRGNQLTGSGSSLNNHNNHNSNNTNQPPPYPMPIAGGDQTEINAISNGPMSFPTPQDYQQLGKPPRSGQVSDSEVVSDYRRNPAASKRESFQGSMYPTDMHHLMENQQQPNAGGNFVTFKNSQSFDNVGNAMPSGGRPKRGILKKNISATSEVSTPDSTRKQYKIPQNQAQNSQIPPIGMSTSYNQPTPNTIQNFHLSNQTRSSSQQRLHENNTQNAYYNARPPTITSRPFSKTPNNVNMQQQYGKR